MSKECFLNRRVDNLIIDIVKEFSQKAYAPSLSEDEIISIEINSLFKFNDLIISKDDVIISKVINPYKLKKDLNKKENIIILDNDGNMLCEVLANKDYILRVKKDQKYKIKYTNKIN